MDLIRLSCPDSKRNFSITVQELRELAGNEAIEALYLQGRYSLEFTPGLEKKLGRFDF